MSISIKKRKRSLLHNSNIITIRWEHPLRLEFNCSIPYNEESQKMNLLIIQNIFFLDLSVIIILMVIAYLSKRLGEALKTPPFYSLFYIGVVVIIVAAIINTIATSRVFPISYNLYTTISMVMRFFSGFISVFACIQYWKWLFSEIFKT